MTSKIAQFLEDRRPGRPCLVFDLDVVEENYHDIHNAMPDALIYYAVKANPAPQILDRLARLGSRFDTASVAEIRMALGGSQARAHLFRQYH